MIKGWEKWIEEYRALINKLEFRDESLSPQEAGRLNYIRNLLEAGLGTKTTLSEDNRRTHLRVPVKLPIKFKTADGEFDAYTWDIGIKGMFICTNQTVLVGSHLEVSLEDTDGEKVKLPAIAKWARHSGEKSLPVGFGVFLTLSLSDTNNLKYHNLFFEKLRSAITEKLG